MIILRDQKRCLIGGVDQQSQWIGGQKVWAKPMAASWNPGMIAGASWLAADDTQNILASNGKVLLWNPKAGTRSLSQPEPNYQPTNDGVVGGKPATRFNQNLQGFNFSDLLPSNYTVISIMQGLEAPRRSRVLLASGPNSSNVYVPHGQFGDGSSNWHLRGGIVTWHINGTQVVSTTRGGSVDLLEGGLKPKVHEFHLTDGSKVTSYGSATSGMFLNGDVAEVVIPPGTLGDED